MGGKVVEGIERLLPSLIVDSNHWIVATNQYRYLQEGRPSKLYA